MCGRFIQSTRADQLAKRFNLLAIPDLTPRYNVAPSQPVLALRMAESGQREAMLLRWGLIPAWSPEPRTAYSTFNARAETVAEKPTYRQAFQQRRCLIPADGFYEWRNVGSRKQPYCIAPVNGRPLAFAGLWGRWERDGQIVESCTILVTQANALITRIHNRMPVILDPKDETPWLNPAITDPAVLKPLLVPCPVEWLRVWPVSTAINTTRHDGPELMAPLQAGLDL